MSTLPTVKVQAPGDPKSFVLINEADFDPKVHVVFGKAKPVTPPTPKAHEGASEADAKVADALLEKPAEPTLAGLPKGRKTSG